MLAAAYDHVEVVKLLLECNVNIKYINNEGDNILMLFLHNLGLSNNRGDCYLSVIMTLINNNVDLMVITKFGETPLLIASKVNDPVLIQLLVIKADAQPQDDPGLLSDLVNTSVADVNIRCFSPAVENRI